MGKYAVIMAGGSGQRLWPLSRETKPKQFIQIDNNESLLVRTIKRLHGLIPAERCFIITNKDYAEITEETVKGLVPKANIILEPMKKDTAACISYATMFLEKKFGSGVVLFLPADSFVEDIPPYHHTIQKAFKEAEETKDIVIIGVKPTHPATGYGYIQVEDDVKDISKVVQFKEKPDLEVAEGYLKSGKYLWNSGMVVGRIDVLIDGIKQLMPKHFARLSKAIKDIHSTNVAASIETAFQQLEAISFDYAFLEKSKNLKVVKGTFDWHDIGSLDAISMFIPPTNENNWIIGDHVGIDTENTIIYSLDNLVATIGIKGMIIVEVDGRIIVCSKDRVQDVKALVQLLKEQGFDKYT